MSGQCDPSGPPLTADDVEAIRSDELVAAWLAFRRVRDDGKPPMECIAAALEVAHRFSHAALAAAQSRASEAERERDEARRRVGELREALGAVGITDGRVNQYERWWWVSRTGDEPICETALEAANAMWAEYEALRSLASPSPEPTAEPGQS